MKQYANIIMDSCGYFGISMPDVDFNARRRNAIYMVTRKLIRISGRYDETECKAALVHELAHHVDYAINLRGTSARAFRTSHDVVFFKILCDLIEINYESIRDYPWHQEYKTIYRWAVSKGYAGPNLNWQGETLEEQRVKVMAHRQALLVLKQELQTKGTAP